MYFYKQPTTPSKTDTIVKNTKPIFANATTNTTAENEPVLETACSSKSTETYIQSSSSTTINSVISDNAACPQTTAQNNSTSGGSITVQTNTITTTTGTTAYTSKTIPDTKTKVDNVVVPITSKTQSTLSKTYSPPNSELTQCSDTTVQSVISQGPSESETNKVIDLSSLSAELEDGKLVEDKSLTVLKDEISNSDTKAQYTSNIFYNVLILKLTFCNNLVFLEIPSQHETHVTKGYEVKETTTGAMANPTSTPVTAATYNTQGTKYYKGRPIQSQPRPTIRDGNNSYNR